MASDASRSRVIPKSREPATRLRRERGVALVVTLILLAVITTLAVAFLALTSRETGAVDSMGRTTDSELAAQSALERAKAQVVAPFPFFNQGTNFGSQIMGPDLTVSVAWDTNRVDFATTGFNELTNLLRDPSPPVFVDTNRAGTTGPGEDRFYLDLNRNRYFEESGHVQVTDDNFRGLANQTNWVVGDPQWIGVLQDPSRPHGPDNRFIARYAFLIQPIGRSLDVNWIHNQALDRPPLNLDVRPGGFNGFFRNQGVGCWELNLAGFLTDLNANYWNDPATGVYGYDPLNYGPQGAALASSAAFIDAREFLRFRCSPSFWNLLAPPGSANRYNDTVYGLLPFSGQVFTNDFVDGYSDGPLSFGPVDESGDAKVPPPDAVSLPWPGADSRRHFSSIHDFFDGNKLTDVPPKGSGFTNKLGQASGRGNSYDRYTYYRMLAQMGTDSAEADEDAGKININYINVGGIKASEMISWTNSNAYVSNKTGRPGPELFFISAATNMFAREPELAFIVTNEFFPGTGIQVPAGTALTIPVFTNRAMGIPGQASTRTTNAPYQGPGVPGPLYAGRIHQILQLAANVHDATTGAKINEAYPYFSSVFRPQFMSLPNGDVYITNYVLAGPASTIISTNQRWLDLDLGDRVARPDDLVYGIPFVIGARKGMPNFNEVVMHTEARFIRRLSMRRDKAGGSIVETNQELELTITNHFAVESRNGYLAAYPRRLQLSVGIRPTYTLSNSMPSSAFSLPATNPISGGLIFPQNSWRKTADKEYQSPLLSTSNQFVLKWVTNSPPDPAGLTNFWALAVTNHFLFFLVDSTYDRIVDAVSLNGPRSLFEFGKELPKRLDVGPERYKEIWSTKVDPDNKEINSGIGNQIFISKTKGYVRDEDWDNYSDQALNKDGGIDGFNQWLIDSNRTDLVRQVPFTPVRVIIQTNFLAVNDPFVHYTEEDMVLTSAAYTAFKRSESVPPFKPERNPRSITWNNGDSSGSTETAGGVGSVNPTLRDPGITVLDRWDFPTSTFANLGWLGRVHRGTPWQTIYLKSKGPTESWKTHSGPSRTDASANSMQPTRDWGLLDVFTASIHPNASRGRLSVNQTNLAAWSAVLSGVVVSRATNDPDAGAIIGVNHVVAPAALDNAVEKIVDGINRARVNAPRGRESGQFFRMGDVLSTPELTFKSPFLNNKDFDAEAPTGSNEQIFDADYERIPQQILSLLKRGEPRFVVYAWGQSLKPARYGVAPDGQGRPMLQGPSIVTAGDDKGLCINYQITGETATKSIIRVDFDRLNDGRLDYRRPHAVVESFNVVPTE